MMRALWWLMVVVCYITPSAWSAVAPLTMICEEVIDGKHSLSAVLGPHVSAVGAVMCLCLFPGLPVNCSCVRCEGSVWAKERARECIYNHSFYVLHVCMLCPVLTWTCSMCGVM